jgi:hypothetical protein
MEKIFHSHHFMKSAKLIYIKICSSVTSCELGILVQFRSCNEEIKISKAVKIKDHTEIF